MSNNKIIYFFIKYFKLEKSNNQNSEEPAPEAGAKPEDKAAVPEKKEGAAASDAKTATNPTLPNANKKKDTTNVAGNLKFQNVHISASPYKVTSCDQVLLIPGKRIFPENDYTKKIDAFFTMSAYMVNSFETKDSNKFLESIAMSHMKTMPYVLGGSKNCLYFQDSITTRKITLCIEDPVVLEEIQTAFMTLFNCRNGRGITGDDKNVEKLAKILCETPKDNKKFDEIKQDFANELRKVGV